MAHPDRSPTVYARFIGVLELYCPACGTLIRERVLPKGPFVVRCNNAACTRHWATGVTVRPVQSGPRSIPPDTIFPPPRWIRERWRSGTNINTLEFDSKDEIPVLLESRRARHRSDHRSDPTSVESEPELDDDIEDIEKETSL